MKLEDESGLPLMEAFYTLQGEGFYTGHAAFFIRLGGCDVECSWCDVKESWDSSKFPIESIEKIIDEAKQHPARIAVITGGEPSLFNLSILTSKLKEAGFQTNIETAGTNNLTGDWDWVCFSPKKFKAPCESIYTQANELKVIINHKSDFEFAEQHKKLVHSNCKLYLQVEWTKSDKLMPLILNYIKENPEWALSLQTHKYLNIP